MEKEVKILIFGITGMLGHVLFKKFSAKPGVQIYGTSRNPNISAWFDKEEREKIRYRGGGVDAEYFDSIIRAVASVKPHIVINCIGIIKQDIWATDPLASITVNALFPHKLSMLCASANAKLIHISTDCVFDGQKGNYTEKDPSDAKDLYGRTKYLGEVTYQHCVTLRVSIIGHELRGHKGLLDWFLQQNGKVKGYTNAIFSGLPTTEFADILGDYIIPRLVEQNPPLLSGLYHISGEPISKFELLKLISKQYNKKIEIIPDGNVKIDRSLNSSLFRKATGYSPPSWQQLIANMHKFYNKYKKLYYQ